MEQFPWRSADGSDDFSWILVASIPEATPERFGIRFHGCMSMRNLLEEQLSPKASHPNSNPVNVPMGRFHFFL